MIVLRTAAMTFGTGHIFLNLDLLFDSGSDLFQVQLYFHANPNHDLPGDRHVNRHKTTTKTAKATKMSAKDVSKL